jgi:GT2 family glycosyltransferase
VPPGISVIICAHDSDRCDDLIAAVESVRAQQVAPDESIVVVDHNPALLDRVRERAPHVIAVANRQARGVSGARNTGLEVASCELVAFLDDDAVALDGWLERLRRSYRDPSVMAAGGSVEPDWPASRPHWFPPEFDWVVGCTYRGMPTTAAPVRNAIGCNMSFRREVFEHVGTFRSDLGRVGDSASGCEETELFLRIRQSYSDRIVLFEPDARVRHRIRSSRTTWSYFRARCLAEGRSKARLSRLAGAAATASERNYVVTTLTGGVQRELGAFLRADMSGGRRALVIIAGLLLTASGFADAGLRARFATFVPGGAQRRVRSPV